ncbi:unnamed protein product [Rotaria socialis]|uniref:WW domain-containing protein n=1 Tax=Rotaria socialis TaxID=392032 RepID=A0A820DRW5_9BILA|nr:unnamed protein product [Rotaria socialis]
MKIFVFFLVLVAALVREVEQSVHANAKMFLAGTNDFIGTIDFYEEEEAWGVVITGFVNRLRPMATLGFHIHSQPIGDNHNCTAGGSHFNPYNVSHGMQTDELLNRHVGDLGNIETSVDGGAYLGLVDRVISLNFNNTRNVIGLPLMIHNLTDDGGHTGKGESNTTGNAGPRIACAYQSKFLKVQLIGMNTNSSNSQFVRSLSDTEIPQHVADEPIAAKPLPPGWEVRTDNSGRTYYLGHNRRRTTWIHPNPQNANITGQCQIHESEASAEFGSLMSDCTMAYDHLSQNVTGIDPRTNQSISRPTTHPEIMKNGPLPTPWDVRTAPSGRYYYIDHVNKRTTWQNPRVISRDHHEHSNSDVQPDSSETEIESSPP